MTTTETAVTVLVTVDEIDAHSGPRFAAELADGVRRLEADGATDLLVDLSGVTFMDSTGIRCLIDADVTLARRGGRIVLSGARGIVLRSLQATGVLDHLASQGQEGDR